MAQNGISSSISSFIDRLGDGGSIRSSFGLIVHVSEGELGDASGFRRHALNQNSRPSTLIVPVKSAWVSFSFFLLGQSEPRFLLSY
jgi:hypothetical protein